MTFLYFSIQRSLGEGGCIVFRVDVEDDKGCRGSDGAEEVECIGDCAVVVHGYCVGYAGIV